MTEINGTEALTWLWGNKSACALAYGRFISTDDAIEFVADLYRMGAETIIIPTDAVRAFNNESAYGYADSLVIKLPNDLASRREILNVYRGELAKRNGATSGKQLPSDFVSIRWKSDMDLEL